MSIPLAIGAVGALAALAAASSSGSTARRGSVEQAVERPRNLFDEHGPTVQAAAMVIAEELGPPGPSAASGERGLTDLIGGFGDIFAKQHRKRVTLQVFRRLGIPEEAADNLLFQTLADYVRSGQQSFVVGPKLQEMFQATKLPKVEPWMLEAPYRCFWIALPGCELKLWGLQDRLASVKGAFVNYDYESGSIAIVMWAPTGGAQMLSEARPELRGRALAVARRKMSYVGNDSYITFNIAEAVSDPAGIESHIMRRWDRAVREDGWPDMVREVSAETRREVLKIVLGTLLYLQSDRQDLSPDRIMQALAEERAGLRERIQRAKNPTKRRKAEQRLASLPSGAVGTWLGRGIEEGTGSEPVQTDGDRRTMRRHWVRGHWRRPARKHGPRVLRWIQPFQRGGGEDITSRTYGLPAEKP